MKPTANSDGEQRRLTDKLNLETAQMRWPDLQSFFAKGILIRIDPSLDLLLVAEQLAADNADAVQQWMKEGSVAKVADDEATRWQRDDVSLWTVVIKPWVLIQEQEHEHEHEQEK